MIKGMCHNIKLFCWVSLILCTYLYLLKCSYISILRYVPYYNPLLYNYIPENKCIRYINFFAFKNIILTILFYNINNN